LKSLHETTSVFVCNVSSWWAAQINICANTIACLENSLKNRRLIAFMCLMAMSGVLLLFCGYACQVTKWLLKKAAQKEKTRHKGGSVGLTGRMR
jgi:hypothetical protein